MIIMIFSDIRDHDGLGLLEGSRQHDIYVKTAKEYTKTQRNPQNESFVASLVKRVVVKVDYRGRRKNREVGRARRRKEEERRESEC